MLRFLILGIFGKLFGREKSLVRFLFFVDIGIFQITDVVILERDAAVKIVVAEIHKLFEQFGIIQRLETQSGELCVVVSAVQMIVLKADAEHFGTGRQPELAGFVAVADRSLTVLLEVDIVFQERQLIVAEEIFIILPLLCFINIEYTCLIILNVPFKLVSTTSEKSFSFIDKK